MDRIAYLQGMARQLRRDVIECVHHVRSGHIGGSLSAADIVAALYFDKLRLRPEQPQWEDRDRFVLSKGHAGPVLYAALARRGYFPLEELSHLRCIESHLQGAPGTKTPGIDMSSGPLGQGMSAALGMALGLRYLKKDSKVFCMVGDGEIQEGQVWEALMAAAAHQTGNLIGILDYNKVQMGGTNEEILPMGDVCAKFSAFGWQVVRIDGHDMRQIVRTLDALEDRPVGPPIMIVADTIKGKGVSFMEGLAKWHSAIPDDEQYAEAMRQLGGEQA
nr:transketolase [Maliibacterium massiliense]